MTEFVLISPENSGEIKVTYFAQICLIMEVKFRDNRRYKINSLAKVDNLSLCLEITSYLLQSFCWRGDFIVYKTFQKQPFRIVLIKRCSVITHQIYRKRRMLKYDFTKVATQLYRNHTSAWGFSCKFAAYF